MAKTKMTSARAFDIANAITRKAIEHEKEAVMKAAQEIPELAASIYAEFVKPHVEALNALPDQFRPPFSTAVNFGVRPKGSAIGDGVTTSCTATFDTPYPCVLRNGPAYYIEVEPEIYEQFVRPERMRNDLANRTHDMLHDLRRNAMACKTVEDLAALWPDAADIILQAAGVVPPVASVTCPLDSLLGKYLRALPAPTTAPMAEGFANSTVEANS